MKRKRNSEPEQVLVDPNLPVRLRANQIISALFANDVILVIADTGSGKTTQIPQLILENDSSASIVVTQPRRVAAISVAARVAAERGCVLGEQVGYAVRFDDKSTRGITRIRYVTDGVMLREALVSGTAGLRKRYSHVIIDEVHERSVDTDIVLGIVKRLLDQRTKSSVGNPKSSSFQLSKLNMRSKLPFKIVIMSATTDENKLVQFFTHNTDLKVGVLNIPGSLHPVRVLNASSPVPDYVDGAVDTSLRVIVEKKEPGDILVFLPGQDDIVSAMTLFRDRLKQSVSKEEYLCVQTFPLFSTLSPEEQLRAISPLPGDQRQTRRKVIFATNIAETSVTIPGIRFVVDSGLMKVRDMRDDKVFNGDVLSLQPVSQAQAEQRKGRAGRTGPGTLFRLYTEEEFQKMHVYPKPEILRTEASKTLLQITALMHFFQLKENRRFSRNQLEISGQNIEEIKNETEKKRKPNEESMLDFPLLDTIPRKAMERGLETLCLLGALNKSMNLTRAGELMSRIPVNPMLARSLLESLRLGCVDAMVSVVAVLSVEGIIFLQVSPTKRQKALAAQRRFTNLNGDHLTCANVLHAMMHLTKTQERMEFCREHFLHFLTLSSAISVRGQLLKILDSGDMKSWALENPVGNEVETEIEEEGMDQLVGRCLVAGFFRNVARKRESEAGYVVIGQGGTELPGSSGDIYPSSVLMRSRRKRTPEFVLYNELVFTSKAYFRMVTGIERRWLTQHSNYYKESALGV